MEIVKKKIDELREPVENVRIHNDFQVNEFVKSLKKYKQYRPAVIDEYGTILVGNGMVKAMKIAGINEVDCVVYKGLNDTEKKKLMLTDNKIFSLGGDDFDNIEKFIKEIVQTDDFDIIGYDANFIKDFFNDDTDENIENDIGLDVMQVNTSNEEKVQELKETIEKEQEKYENALEVNPKINDQSQRKFVVCPQCGQVIYLD